MCVSVRVCVPTSGPPVGHVTLPMLAGRTGGTSLPPVRHLPHWTRLSSLGRPRSPPLPAVQPSRAGPSRNEPSRTEPSRAEGQEQRLASLQRSLEFVQQQHRDTLQRLHAEIDHLRRENKGDVMSAGRNQV